MKEEPLPSFKLERNLLKDRVVSLLREYIIGGRIRPGAKLVERELAELLGVSRMPIHDALVHLEKEGLVVSKVDARYVIRLTEKDICELFQIRTRLEILAVELALPCVRQAEAAALSEMVRQIQEAVEKKDFQAYTQSDIEMHRYLWQLSGNNHLLKILNTMIGPIFIFIANNAHRYEWEETLHLHQELVQRILAGDVAGAKQSMQHHMENALMRSLRVL